MPLQSNKMAIHLPQQEPVMKMQIRALKEIFGRIQKSHTGLCMTNICVKPRRVPVFSSIVVSANAKFAFTESISQLHKERAVLLQDSSKVSLYLGKLLRASFIEPKRIEVHFAHFTEYKISLQNVQQVFHKNPDMITAQTSTGKCLSLPVY